VTGTRLQARIDTIAEIKRLAREQIRNRGAANLSLREVARTMGLASSALYRYFASRDDLLTAMIVDGYDDLGITLESADASARRDDLAGRWMSVAGAMRSWALAQTADYALIFGTPVPGYHAPDDTVAPAKRHTDVLLALLVDAERAGRRPRIVAPAARDAAREYSRVRANLGLEVSDALLLAGLGAWATMIGAINLEVFGHVDTVFERPEVHYRAMMAMLADQMFGDAPGS